MRDVVVLVDGADHDPSAPAVTPLDPGLLGQGVYDSIRTYDGECRGVAVDPVDEDGDLAHAGTLTAAGPGPLP